MSRSALVCGSGECHVLVCAWGLQLGYYLQKRLRNGEREVDACPFFLVPVVFDE